MHLLFICSFWLLLVIVLFVVFVWFVCRLFVVCLWFVNDLFVICLLFVIRLWFRLLFVNNLWCVRRLLLVCWLIDFCWSFVVCLLFVACCLPMIRVVFVCCSWSVYLLFICYYMCFVLHLLDAGWFFVFSLRELFCWLFVDWLVALFMVCSWVADIQLLFVVRCRFVVCSYFICGLF